jgi:CrcB protein
MSGSIAVLIGSALGGLARYWLAIWVGQLTGPRLPWGTLLINIVGSFVIGWFGALASSGRIAASPELRLFVMVGICGGFTTFSSFSLQTLNLVQNELYAWAAAYVLGSVALCLAAVTLGYAAGR